MQAKEKNLEEDSPVDNAGFLSMKAVVSPVRGLYRPGSIRRTGSSFSSSSSKKTAGNIFPKRLFYRGCKRFIDIFVSLTLLAIGAPFMLLLSLIVRLSSPGPAIFCQRRVTTGGRIFTMFKFRTMRADAEIRSGAVWAAKDDPRVTRVGAIMRRTRLDELPQLINVVIGDMSLIGPRPERPEMIKGLLKEFPGFSKRHIVQSGLSGLAQVSNGYADSVDSYREKLLYDYLYINKRSLLLDSKIALKTIVVIFTGRGAR